MGKIDCLFGEYFEYEPTDKIWFMTNHRPIIKGNDEGIWRRVHLIPFTVSIPAEERDKDLGEKLLKELPGILNWAIEGCLLYLKEGLKSPHEVRAASESYRAEMDMVSAFVQECCVVDVSGRMRLKDLYAVYVRWCEENGSAPVSGRKLVQRGGMSRGIRRVIKCMCFVLGFKDLENRKKKRAFDDAFFWQIGKYNIF